MGYTHYWYKQKEVELKKFKKIVDDFKKVLPEIIKVGVVLADGSGEGEPILNYNLVSLNGAIKCGHLKNEAISIPWPSKNAGGVAKFLEDAKKGNWFAGAEIEKRCCDGDCSYESFIFERIFNGKFLQKENGLYFDFCKTAFRPYDLAVITFLIIAKHHLGKGIKVSSDGEDCHWFDGKLLCQQFLGYGFEYKIGEKERTLEKDKKEKSNA
ncbi:MAG TPA: hypothetical protein ENH41_03425 [Candidatus Omnitrophica bacterium]|nr:hypothetical protein [Candidatus Omnitrophota bacterium]